MNETSDGGRTDVRVPGGRESVRDPAWSFAFRRRAVENGDDEMNDDTRCNDINNDSLFNVC